MKLTQAGVTAVLTTVASTVAGLLPLLVEQHVLTASLAAVIGGFVASLTAGWHGNTAVAKRQAAKAVAVDPFPSTAGPSLPDPLA